MDKILWSNNEQSTLQNNLGIGVTTLTLAAGTGALWPNPGADEYFTITMTDADTQTRSEIIYCTARTGDVCSGLLRGREGTSDQSWIVGDIAGNLVTAGSLESMQEFTQDGDGAVLQTVQEQLRDAITTTSNFGITIISSATTNTDKLYKAIDSLNDGGTLTINKDIEINEEVPFTRNNVNLTSKANNLITQLTAGKRVFYGEDRENINIYGIRFDGTDASVPYNGAPLDGSGRGLLHFYKNSGQPRNIKIFGVEIYNAFTPISVTNCHNLWVRKNIIRNFYKFGILASESYNFHIDINQIYTCLNNNPQNTYGIQATGDEAAGDVQRNCSINFNIIDGVKSWDAIMSHDCTNLVISGNIITDVRTGIDIGYTAANQIIKDVQVYGNLIGLTSQNNWASTPAPHAGILFNGLVLSSAFVDGVEIAHNIIRNANNIAGTVLSGNIYAAIHLDTVADINVNNNIILGVGNEFPDYNGVGVFNPGSNVKITKNTTKGNISTSGVKALLNNGTTCYNLDVSGNTFDSSQSSAHHTIFGVNSGSGTFENLSCTGNITNTTSKDYLKSGSVTLNMSQGDSVFTGTFKINGVTTGITTTENVGNYTRQDAYFDFESIIVLSSKGAQVGAVTLENLPFFAASSPSETSFPFSGTNLSGITGQLIAVIAASSNTIQFYQLVSGSLVALTNSNLTNTSKISISGRYKLS